MGGAVRRALARLSSDKTEDRSVAAPSLSRAELSADELDAVRREIQTNPEAGAAFREKLRSDPAAREAFRADLLVQKNRPPVAECPICETTAAEFLPFGARVPVPDRKCPTCGSLERHRLIWLYFREKTNLFTDDLTVLHVAPEPWFVNRLRRSARFRSYITADIADPKVSVRMDLTRVPCPSRSVDVVYASHVLEHIPDDALAMREIYRILKPGGWAVLQVPIWGESTQEDLTITDPDERQRRYGQFDHVRMYGHDAEYERRLAAAGFHVDVDRFAATLEPDRARSYRLDTTEDIYLCSKPADDRHSG